MVNPVTVIKTSSTEGFLKRIKGIGERVVYVGIPAGSTRGRAKDVKIRAGRFISLNPRRRKIKARLKKMSKLTNVSNAQALYLFSKGSALRNQPARPVLEPAIIAPGNRQRIADLIAKSTLEYSHGRLYESKRLLKSAGVVAEKVCKAWFTDPRNNWAPNAQRTIQSKGKDAPGLDTEIMRAAITHIEKDTYE
jgi:hypothetical protein